MQEENCMVAHLRNTIMDFQEGRIHDPSYLLSLIEAYQIEFEDMAFRNKELEMVIQGLQNGFYQQETNQQERERRVQELTEENNALRQRLQDPRYRDVGARDLIQHLETNKDFHANQKNTEQLQIAAEQNKKLEQRIEQLEKENKSYQKEISSLKLSSQKEVRDLNNNLNHLKSKCICQFETAEIIGKAREVLSALNYSEIIIDSDMDVERKEVALEAMRVVLADNFKDDFGKIAGSISAIMEQRYQGRWICNAGLSKRQATLSYLHRPLTRFECTVGPVMVTLFMPA